MSTKRINIIESLLIVSILVLASFSLIGNVTYAETISPNHWLTYYGPNDMTWDTVTKTYKDNEGNDWGELYLFVTRRNTENGTSLNGNSYEMETSDGDQIIAPGTGGTDCVRVLNNCDRNVSYVSVLYKIQNNNIPIKGELSYTHNDATDVVVPDNAILLDSAVGTIDAKKFIDIPVSWEWPFYESDPNDVYDTSLGDLAVTEDQEIKVYLKVIITEDETLPTPTPTPTPTSSPTNSNGGSSSYVVSGKSGSGPKTGDTFKPNLYFVLIIISILLLIIVFRRKEKRRDGRENILSK